MTHIWARYGLSSVVQLILVINMTAISVYMIAWDKMNRLPIHRIVIFLLRYLYLQLQLLAGHGIHN